MKKIIYLLTVILVMSVLDTENVFAQGVGINSAGNPPDPSAILDANSTTKGQLIPRMTTAQRDAIVAPAIGLQIYNTECNTFNYYNGGSWISTGNAGTVTMPSSIGGNTSPCQNSTGTSYSVTAVTGASGYSWIVPPGSIITAGQGTASITVSFATTSGNVCVIASSACGTSNPSCTPVTLATGLTSGPTAATHTSVQTQITWNWNTVSGATGYKYNTINNFSGAADNGTGTSYIQTGLTCNTVYTLYVWAYNACGNSVVTSLTQSTASCFSCPSSITINHTTGNGVAPVAKTVTYGVILSTLSGADKCWITQNLGSSNQASSPTDASEAAAGWYWQFNRKQGYKHDGTTRTPSTTWDITNDNQSSTWQAAKDPCTIELGAGWRVPNQSEWVNVDANAGWSNYNDAYSSVFKLHAAGRLLSSDGSIHIRGINGYEWTSTQFNSISSYYLAVNASVSLVSDFDKSYGFPVRCIKD